MIKTLEDINLEELKKNHLDLYYFGLGFIQLKIDRYHRLHFYDPTLPTITGEEEVHNHRYDFESLVLSGTLENYLYDLIPGDEFSISQENCKPGEPDYDLVKKPCGLTQVSLDVYHGNTKYFMDHRWFHRVQTKEETITFLKRTDYKKELADVVRPKNMDKVCPFSLVIPKEELWNRIETMLARAKNKKAPLKKEKPS